MRSLKGVFAWATCPFVLKRFARDLSTVSNITLGELPEVKEERALIAPGSPLMSEGTVVLEEYAFTPDQQKAASDLGQWLATHALPQEAAYSYWREVLPQKLVVLSDDDFRDFTRHATEVVARIKLNKRKTTTGNDGNLFYQENLPAESLLYSLVFAQDDLSGKLTDGKAADLIQYVRTLDGQRLQIGGDASTGRGITATRFLSA